ncbi:hypothetical protein A9Z65_00580 [Moraxella nonliquefaciens]|nr:hypothetical protein A9Z65_00580 [Moraxella nonliquefaciens]
MLVFKASDITTKSSQNADCFLPSGADILTYTPFSSLCQSISPLAFTTLSIIFMDNILNNDTKIPSCHNP